jgi:hypothetical protein
MLDEDGIKKLSVSLTVRFEPRRAVLIFMSSLSVVNSRISRIARVYYIFGRKNEPFHDFSDP